MNSTLKPTVSPLQLRDELETMVLKELLGPGSAEEEIIESHGTRYFVGVLAPRKRARAGAASGPATVVPPPAIDNEDEETDGEIVDGRPSFAGILDLGQNFHGTNQGVRYTISEPARRDVLARLLKLNRERYAEEVKQGLHDKKTPKRSKKKANMAIGPTLYDQEEGA
jgi:hypothetical protein